MKAVQANLNLYQSIAGDIAQRIGDGIRRLGAIARRLETSA